MRRPVLLSILTLVLAVGWLPGCSSETTEFDTVERGLSVCASGPTLEGIDVSYWQPNIDWDAVAAGGISFAFIRVSDGVTTYDTDFQYNWSEAQRVGIVRGVYQFFRPNQDPVAQADLLIAEIGGAMTPGDLPPVIDVEANGGLSKATVATKIQQWIDRIESVLGVTPIVYTSPGLWSSYVASNAFSAYPLWVAHYYVTCPTMPTGWTHWWFHQYTDSGSIPGINSGSVDRNVFNGDMADLLDLTWGTPVCGDGVCNSSEDSASCPSDCPTCEPIPAVGRTVEETEVCMEWGGDMQYWRTESAGSGGSLRWTNAVSTQVYNYAVWNLDFEQSGLYRIEAYTDGAWAESQQAKYQVHANGATTVVEVDQTQTNGWTVIGEFDFAAGDGQWVRLEDLTGEPGSSQTAVVVDALRVYPVVPQQQEPDPDPDPEVCQPIPAEGRVMEQTEACMEWGGDEQWWRDENAGHGGSLRWTNAVSSQFYNYGVWNLDFEQGGWYRVEAYTPAPWAESRQARYQVRHGSTTDTQVVDQTAVDGWAEVGVFQFSPGDSQWIRLEDLTGESGSLERAVVFDALRLTPVADANGCELIPTAGRTIDNDDECLELGGPSQYWRTENEGYGGTLRWTNTVSDQVYNYAEWTLAFQTNGIYRVEVYTAQPWGESEQAKYQVHAGGTTTTVTVDQSAQDGWVEVGEFEFEAGEDQWLRVEDLTGEPGWSDTRLVVDAIRVTLVQTTYSHETDRPAQGIWGSACNASSTDPSGALPLLLPLLVIGLRRRRRD